MTDRPACTILSSMKPEERERFYHLCAMIEKEKNHGEFLRLLEELNRLLERKERRLEDETGD